MKNNELVYTKKQLRTKINSYDGKINTICHKDRMRKESSYCIYFH